LALQLPPPALRDQPAAARRGRVPVLRLWRLRGKRADQAERKTDRDDGVFHR